LPPTGRSVVQRLLVGWGFTLANGANWVSIDSVTTESNGFGKSYHVTVNGSDTIRSDGT